MEEHVASTWNCCAILGYSRVQQDTPKLSTYRVTLQASMTLIDMASHRGRIDY